MNGQTKTLGIISLIIGIISLLFFCIPVVSIIMAGSGLAIGIIAIRQSKDSSGTNGLAIAGTVLSGMALLIGLIWNIIVFTGGKSFIDENKDDWWDKNDYYYDDYYDTDTNYMDIDSLMLDDDEINDLDNSMNDEDNGPGPAPN